MCSAAVESTGQAKAEAQSRAEASKIEGEAAVEQAKLKAQASKIEAVSYYLLSIRDLIVSFSRNLSLNVSRGHVKLKSSTSENKMNWRFQNLVSSLILRPQNSEVWLMPLELILLQPFLRLDQKCR